MGTLITGKKIIDAAVLILQDADNVRWTRAELLGWLNSGQKELVILKPDALTQNTTIPMVAGTKQQLPASGLCLIDVIRNYGPQSAPVAGRAIVPISRSILDTSIPDWHSANPSAVVKHSVFDVRDPKRFYVYPPQPVGPANMVEVVMSVEPAVLGNEDALISLDDIYENALLDYVLYRAFGKDAEAGNAERSSFHYQAFASALGGKTQGTVAVFPQAQAAPQGR